MRKIGRINTRGHRERRPRAPLPAPGHSTPATVIDQESLLTTGPDDMVWVKATAHSVQNLSARIRSDVSSVEDSCSDVAARLVSKKYACFDDFFHATRVHPYMCFTTVGLWSKKVKEHLGERSHHLEAETLGEWFWTVFRRVQ
jgi:hypothetical protein